MPIMENRTVSIVAPSLWLPKPNKLDSVGMFPPLIAETSSQVLRMLKSGSNI